MEISDNLRENSGEIVITGHVNHRYREIGNFLSRDTISTSLLEEVLFDIPSKTAPGLDRCPL